MILLFIYVHWVTFTDDSEILGGQRPHHKQRHHHHHHHHREKKDDGDSAVVNLSPAVDKDPGDSGASFAI